MSSLTKVTITIRIGIVILAAGLTSLTVLDLASMPPPPPESDGFAHGMAGIIDGGIILGSHAGHLHYHHAHTAWLDRSLGIQRSAASRAESSRWDDRTGHRYRTPHWAQWRPLLARPPWTSLRRRLGDTALAARRSCRPAASKDELNEVPDGPRYGHSSVDSGKLPRAAGRAVHPGTSAVPYPVRGRDPRLRE